MLEIAETQAAPLFFDRDAMQTQFAHLGPQVAGKGVGFVDLGRAGGQPVGSPAGGGVTDGVSGLAEAEFHRLGGVGNAHGAGLAPAGAVRKTRKTLPVRSATFGPSGHTSSTPHSR